MLCNYRQADEPGRPGEARRDEIQATHLARTLPCSRRVEFPGLDHGASSDPSPTNPGGKPEIVAQVAGEVRTFFATLNTPQETQ